MRMPLGHDDGARRGVLQALIQREQPLAGQAGVGDCQRRRPGGPQRVRDGHLGQAQGGIDGFGAFLAQHRGQDGAGRGIDGDGQLGPHRPPGPTDAGGSGRPHPSA